MDLKIKKLHPNAKMPTFGTEGAGCFDLYVSERTVLKPYVGTLVPTGLAFEVPEGYVMNLYLRSSMCKKCIIGSTGVVDSDYRGEVKVQATNISPDGDFILEVGDRIGQGRLEKLELTTLVWADELSETKRGTAGYGSTGK